ncbi:hypothetical protein FQA39_LY13457 [Lamprigera yunnana]|nr:hypothetical protein FQA39_LY13457 [Lamprigera yunnana]
MNSKVYKWCAVPLYKNTSIETPNKVFVYVPNNKKLRNKSLILAPQDPAKVATSSSIYFCEDHFDLPNDMENYMKYHLMESVSQVRMKPGCIPTKFACQPGRKTGTSVERQYIRKKQKMMVIEECEKQLEESNRVTEHFDFEDIASRSSGYVCFDHSCYLVVSNDYLFPFQLPNDMENYMKYHLMESVSQVRMKPGCIPTKFACQPGRKTGTSVERQYIRKKQKMMVIEECEKQLEEKVQVHIFQDLCNFMLKKKLITQVDNLFGCLLPFLKFIYIVLYYPVYGINENQQIKKCDIEKVQHNLEEAQHVTSKMIDKSIQVHMTKTIRSKGNQIGARLVNQMTSPLKPQLHSASTSLFKIKHNVNSNPSILTEQSDSDISYTPSVTHTESSLSTKSLQMESDSDCSEMIEDDKKNERI